MKVTHHKGTSRYVICVPSLKIVIKFPVMHFKDCYHLIFNYGIKRGCLKQLLTNSVYRMVSIRGQLFRGFVDNWKEFCFYRETKNEFLQPTYFSLLGFINFQKLGSECNLTYIDHWSQIRTITNQEAYCDPHHFSEPRNFCLEDGLLKMLDYGNPKTHEVIAKYGTVIQEKYDINFSWEEYIESRKEKEVIQ